jgi:hypothetical protein
MPVMCSFFLIFFGMILFVVLILDWWMWSGRKMRADAKRKAWEEDQQTEREVMRNYKNTMSRKEERN